MSTNWIASGISLPARRIEYNIVEYLYIVNDEQMSEKLTAWLNKQAAQRWRLIALVNQVYYFERELHDNGNCYNCGQSLGCENCGR